MSRTARFICAASSPKILKRPPTTIVSAIVLTSVADGLYLDL